MYEVIIITGFYQASPLWGMLDGITTVVTNPNPIDNLTDILGGIDPPDYWIILNFGFFS